MLPGKPFLIGLLIHWKKYFCGNYHFITGGILLKGATKYLFAYTDGVHICSVEKINTKLQRHSNNGTGFLLLDSPLPPFFRPKGHAAQTDSRNLQSCSS